MSWPAVGGGTWPVVGTGVPAAAGGQDMSMMMGQFTPEQWAAMQQQNWQQWTQWQQQYAQWQSQYGEKYAQMQAMATGGTGGPAPPLPTQPCQPAPPPPEKPPPPPHENNQPLFQSAGAAKPVPPVSNAMLQHNQGNHQTQDNSRDPNSWNSSRPDRNANADWNTSDNNYAGNSKDNWSNPNDWKQNSNQGNWNRNQKQNDYNNQNQGNWNHNQNDWKANNNSQSWSSDGPGSGTALPFDKTHQKAWGETGASHVNSEALKKHEEEERLFDIQFQKWEEEFDKWKQQNINHPDKKAYADYEEKFETCRAQLMERRQQMKQKKLKLMGNSAPPTPKKDPPPPANKEPVQAPPQNYNHYVEPDKSSQYNQESSQFDQYNYTPGGNSNDSFNTNSNFLSSSEQRKGIPGLDLVDEEDSAKIPSTNDQENVIDITEDPPAKTEQDFSAISKGIVNNILGDEKILNMLSIVKGQMQPNSGRSGGSPANSGPYDISGPNSSPMAWQNQNFQGQNRPNQNFPNQNRDSSTFNQQRGFNNAQMQQGGLRHGPMSKDMQQGRMGDMQQGRMGDMPPGRMGDMPPGRMGDMPQGRMGDMPPGRMGDMPPGRMGDMPPGRMGDMPPGRMGDMPPGRMGDMPPGRMGDMPPGRMSDMPPGRMGDMPPGRMGDMPPGRMGDMPPGRMSNMPPGRMGDMPPGRMGDMPPGRMGDMPPGRMGDMPPGRRVDMPPGRMSDMPPSRMGDIPPGRMGDMPPGRMGDIPPGRMSDMPPGRMGDLLPGRMGDMPPGRMGDIPPGRIGDMPPGRMGDMPAGRMGDMPPGRMGDMPPGRMGDMQRGSNFSGPNYNSGPGRSDIPRPPGQGSNYENTGPQFRGRSDFPPHPDGLRRGNNFNQGPNFGGSPRPSRPDFGPRPDGMRHADDFQSGPKLNSGPQPNLDRPEFPLRGENRGQDFQNASIGMHNMGMNPNMRPQPNMGPQNQEINRNLDMGIQRPDMFMTQERGRGAGMQQDRMGMQGSNQFAPNQGGIQPLMGSKIDPPENLMKGQSSIIQGPIETEEAPFKRIEETILEPSIIVDYEHKPLRMKVRDFIEPVQTFDYNHISKEDSKKGTKPGDRWSELDTYNQRSGTKVIDYKNRSLNDSPGDQARRRYDREPDRRDRFDDREPDRRDRFDDRRRDERKDDRRRDDRPDDRRRDERMRQERYRGRDERVSPDNRSRERVDWNRRDRDRDRDSHRPERSKEKPRDQSVESVKSAKPEKVDSPATNPVVMIDDLLDPPGRDVRPEKIVIILRGIPGSGKSYLAKLIKDREVQNGGSAPRILSIDDYFIQEVEVEEEDPATGKKVKKSTNQYVYDERQEENYLNSLKRAYRRTIADHFFPFIIVDCCNEQVKMFAELWNFGRQNGFQVYLCTLECDVQTAFKRNVHKRTLEDLQVIAARFAVAPKNYVTIDPTTLLQNAAIQEVHMEDVNSDDDVVMEDAMDDPESEPLDHFTSKWERMEDSDRLARLDGTSKPLRPSQFSLDEYLQLDDWQPQRSAQPGKKTVRWADIEERREQEKMRAIGFVVGQTDWNRMTDPTLGSSALTQTKYIERTHRPYK